MTSPTPALSADAAAWPEGVLYRFPTLFGSTVDVSEARVPGMYEATCRACDAAPLPHTRNQTNEWAQEHSGKCRALPRPTA
ncbi:hypothetical protein [Streptomyces sp. NBC_01262]|uniref:hypothetical protein n=1 Tax=Streptomyces sp. NBC_01262 TaxID=2903803 RepID=UPI002E36C37F|nr:hypothetical protein [Streptomyces sp. NBC_01262]